VAHDKMICNPCNKLAKRPARGKSGDVFPADETAPTAVEPSQAESVAPAPTADQGSSQLVCPHCQTKGSVTTAQVKVKKGISGGKATAAVMTVGFSVVATGLSRKEKLTQLTCSNCGMSWQVQ
jgi:transcription elongation factor Elf1